MEGNSHSVHIMAAKLQKQARHNCTLHKGDYTILIQRAKETLNKKDRKREGARDRETKRLCVRVLLQAISQWIIMLYAL